MMWKVLRTTMILLIAFYEIINRVKDKKFRITINAWEVLLSQNEYYKKSPFSCARYFEFESGEEWLRVDKTSFLVLFTKTYRRFQDLLFEIHDTESHSQISPNFSRSSQVKQRTFNNFPLLMFEQRHRRREIRLRRFK